MRRSGFLLRSEFKRLMSRIFFFSLSDRNWVLALLSLRTAVYKSTWCGPLCSSGSRCSTVMSRTTSELCTWRQRKGSSRTTMWVSQLISWADKFKVKNLLPHLVGSVLCLSWVKASLICRSVILLCLALRNCRTGQPAEEKLVPWSWHQSRTGCGQFSARKCRLSVYRRKRVPFSARQSTTPTGWATCCCH